MSSERDLHVSLSKRDTRVQPQVSSEHDLCVSLIKRDRRVQPQMAKISSELGSPYPHGFKASSLETPTNLRDYSTEKEMFIKLLLNAPVSGLSRSYSLIAIVAFK